MALDTNQKRVLRRAAQAVLDLPGGLASHVNVDARGRPDIFAFLARRRGLTTAEVKTRSSGNLQTWVGREYGMTADQTHTLLVANDSTHSPKQAAERVSKRLRRLAREG